ncbi:MAG: SUMF1/EgtB/PvdO family nonheme iron enzyme, partial [Bryobacterales bacterium]|nr:SUMF1/EgtB/PvdO family nonheme iron enzyme [Bryobacterales bacterium]
MLRLGILVLLALVSGLPHATAAVDFEKDIAPILRSSCMACHSARAGMGNVRLHNREALNAKASLGAVVVPGDPQKSALYLSLMLPKGNPKAMPPTGPLPDAKRELVRQWIAEGAIWPTGFEFGVRPPASPRSPSSEQPKPAATLKDDLDLVKAARMRIRERSQHATMQPYDDAIPATDVSLRFVPIPGGEFAMGSPDGEPGRQPTEGPVHRVKVDPFWMSAFEISWDSYRLFMFATEANEAQNPDAMVSATSRPTAPYVEMSFGMGLNGYPAISMTQHAANKFAQW